MLGCGCLSHVHIRTKFTFLWEACLKWFRVLKHNEKLCIIMDHCRMFRRYLMASPTILSHFHRLRSGPLASGATLSTHYPTLVVHVCVHIKNGSFIPVSHELWTNSKTHGINFAVASFATFFFIHFFLRLLLKQQIY